MGNVSYTPNYGEWLARHLDYYSFLGENANKLKKDIMSIQDLYSSASDNMLVSCYLRFVNLYKGNVYDTAFGLYKEGILAKNIKGVLKKNTYGLLSPCGMMDEDNITYLNEAPNFLESTVSIRIKEKEEELLGELRNRKQIIEKVNSLKKSVVPSNVRGGAILILSVALVALAVIKKGMFSSLLHSDVQWLVGNLIVLTLALHGILSAIREFAAVKRSKSYVYIKEWALTGKDETVKKPILAQFRNELEEKIKTGEPFVIPDKKKELENYFEDLAEKKSTVKSVFKRPEKTFKKRVSVRTFALVLAFLIFLGVGNRIPAIDAIIENDNSINNSSNVTGQQPKYDNETNEIKQSEQTEPVFIMTGVEKVTISETKETSYLKSSKNDWSAKNTIDEKIETCWQDGVDGDGVGESLTYILEKPGYIVGVDFINGRVSSEKAYWANARIAELQLDFIYNEKGNGSIVITLPDVYTVEPNYISFFSEDDEKSFYCDTVILTITAVYNGQKYNDLCLTEVKLYEGIYEQAYE